MVSKQPSILETPFARNVLPGALWVLFGDSSDKEKAYVKSLDISAQNQFFKDLSTKTGKRPVPIVLARMGNVLQRDRYLKLLPELTGSTNMMIMDALRAVVSRYSSERLTQSFGTDDVEYITGTKIRSLNLAEALRQLDMVNFNLNIKPETDVPRPKTVYSSRPTGVFNFSRAAATLHAYPCFREVDSNSEQCLPTKEVVAVEGSRTGYVHGPTGHDVVVSGYETDDNGRVKWRSNTRRVYAVRTQTTKVVPYVHIYVNMSASYNVDAVSLRYNSICGAILAQYLEQAGFKVKITSILPAHNTSWVSVLTYNVKDYQETLDLNQAILLGGEPAFFRWEGFQDMVRIADASGYTARQTLGVPLTNVADTDEMLYALGLYEVENEARVIIADRFSEKLCQDGVRQALQSLRQLYGTGD